MSESRRFSHDGLRCRRGGWSIELRKFLAEQIKVIDVLPLQLLHRLEQRFRLVCKRATELPLRGAPSIVCS